MTYPIKLGTVAHANNVVAPWKANGSVVEPDAPLTIWQEQAGLNYEIVPTPSQYVFNDELRTVPNRMQLVRSDTGESLAEMSASNYKIRQPAQILEFFRALTEANSLRMTVIGQMQGGKKIFGFAESEVEAEIGKGSNDIIRQNVFFLESSDGTFATSANPTANRFFCLNQIHTGSSLIGGKQGAIKQRHNSHFNIDRLLLDMGLMTESFLAYAAIANELAKIRITEEMAVRFFARLYAPEVFDDSSIWLKSKMDFERESEEIDRRSGQPKKLVSTNSVNLIAELMDLRKDSPGWNSTACENTLYGALNTVTYYHDHKARTKGSKRYESAMIGNGATTKTQALELAKTLLEA